MALAKTTREDILNTFKIERGRAFSQEHLFLTPTVPQDVHAFKIIDSYKSRQEIKKYGPYFGYKAIEKTCDFFQKANLYTHPQRENYLFGRHSLFLLSKRKPILIGQVTLGDPRHPFGDPLHQTTEIYEKHHFGWSEILIDIHPKYRGKGFGSQVYPLVLETYKNYFGTKPLILHWPFECNFQEVDLNEVAHAVTLKRSLYPFAGIESLVELKNHASIKVSLKAKMKVCGIYKNKEPSDDPFKNEVIFRYPASSHNLPEDLKPLIEKVWNSARPRREKVLHPLKLLKNKVHNTGLHYFTSQVCRRT